MDVDAAVNYNPDNGEVKVSVLNTGYANQGSFGLSVTDGNVLNDVGEGLFGDGVPDIFVLPVSGPALTRWTLIINGAYAAAAGHTQIKVDYVFFQQGEEIYRELIRVNESPLSATHTFTFNPIS